MLIIAVEFAFVKPIFRLIFHAFLCTYTKLHLFAMKQWSKNDPIQAEYIECKVVKAMREDNRKH